ncbi:galanin receptor 2b-like [Asterias amurensis]|uniref:galanin receptor 2b-like n=1 Tax=Asterias amurensis TaxID=7602 RepID=UPI003AB63902
MADGNLSNQIFQCAVGVVGICGNGLVCVVITKIHFMHTITNAFILNQAVIDFFGSLLILLSSLIPISDPIPSGVGGVLLCHVWVSKYFIWAIFTTSTFNLVALTLERYLAIVFPFKYQTLATRRNVTVALLCVWVSAFLFVTYNFFLRNLDNGKCLQRSVKHPEILGVATVSVIYMVPVIVMLIVYVHISVVLTKGAERVGPAPSAAAISGGGVAIDNQRESLMRARRNTFKTLLIVFISFTVCWTPNCIIFTLFSLGYEVDLSSSIYLITVAMVSLNSCVNPFIYAIKYKQFRKALKIVFGRPDQSDESSY